LRTEGAGDIQTYHRLSSNIDGQEGENLCQAATKSAKAEHASGGDPVPTSFQNSIGQANTQVILTSHNQAFNKADHLMMTTQFGDST
jgi:hypothetical protein